MKKITPMTPVLLACAVSLLALPASALLETFEGEATGTFDGTADLTWVGDVDSWNIATADWPTLHDFNGSRSLQGDDGGRTAIACA